MGQYYIFVNITKKQYIDPNDLGFGIKYGEFDKLYKFMWLLCMDANFQINIHNLNDYLFSYNIHEMIGKWRGDIVILAGDESEINITEYGLHPCAKDCELCKKTAEEDDSEEYSHSSDECWNLNDYASIHFTNISDKIKDLVDKELARVDLSSNE
jgi:hypothetical protein